MATSEVRPHHSVFPIFLEGGGANRVASTAARLSANKHEGNGRSLAKGYKKGLAGASPSDERRFFGCEVRRMVACAVATSAAHPTSSVVGGGERRAPVASPEVSRLQPKAGAMAVTPAASIEQLKHQLQTAIENKDSEKATLAIEELERVILSREILESTRIGLYVNHARKDMGDMWPPLSKRCRGLIKAWQKLVEPTTNSSSASTSRNGTPSLASPAVGRRLTPHTPVNKRITPGIASERASNLSPGVNGSYAPKGLSPGLHGMHKSHSVGIDLNENGGGVRNGKRKQDEPVVGIAPSSIKRARTTASGLSAAGGAMTSPAPPATPSLIAMRRAEVLSTSDLVAQLTSNLPQHLGFEDAARAHEEKVKRELEDQQLAAAIANGGEPAHSPYVFDKKRKYERKKPLAGTPSGGGASASSSTSSTTTVRIVTPPRDEEGGKKLVLKLSLSRTTTDMGTLAQQAATPATTSDRKEEKERRKREKREALHASRSAPSLEFLADDGASTSSSSPAPPAPVATPAAGPALSATAAWLASSSSSDNSLDGKEKKKEKIDWLAMVPSIEELQARVAKDNQRRKILDGIKDSEKAYTLRLGGDRVMLALPYIEIEDRPDFLKFNYPDPGRYYAEENFIGGLMERPVHPAPPPPPASTAAAGPSTSAAVQK